MWPCSIKTHHKIKTPEEPPRSDRASIAPGVCLPAVATRQRCGRAGREMIRAAHFASRGTGFEKIRPVLLRCADAARSAILVYARARQRNRWAGIAGNFSNEMRRAFSVPSLCRHHPNTRETEALLTDSYSPCRQSFYGTELALAIGFCGDDRAPLCAFETGHQKKIFYGLDKTACAFCAPSCQPG